MRGKVCGSWGRVVESKSTLSTIVQDGREEEYNAYRCVKQV